MNLLSHKIPALACQLAHAHEAWIVGSAARPRAFETVRDFDVMVPFSHWVAAAMLILGDAVPNTFGGWKCQSEGCEIDVWPGELGWVMTNHASEWAWHPRSGVRIQKQFDPRGSAL